MSKKAAQTAPAAEDRAPAGGATTSADLPEWFPIWARRIAELYFSGTTSMFALHGNTWDLTWMGAEDRYGTLAEFLAEQLFGRWDLVLHYDLARGIRCLAGRNARRLEEMVATANRRLGDVKAIERKPLAALAALDRLVQFNATSNPERRLSCAVIIEHASFVAPAGGRQGADSATCIATLLGWAASPYVKRLNMAFVMVDPALTAISERLVGNPHVAAIDVPLPAENERLRYIEAVADGRQADSVSDYSWTEIADLTAGISLTDLGVLLGSAIEGGTRLDANRFRELKKRLIERQAHGLLEFIEPKWGLDMVVGHDGAKARLKQDAELLARGRLQSVPMGYLFCGPVGTGKSFLAQCAAGSVGIPCVKLKNFRSKYVGETEANLEKVLGVLRGMGPVAVIVDEADAMLGDRQQGGDSGVGSRVFGMIAAQMGDTTYRGKILWMLLTARPDLLPIDLKRQGRAEVHVPLFYPTSEEEVKQLFVVLAKKSGAKLAAKDVPPCPHTGSLSGADVEGIVGRAWRAAMLADEDHISRKRLKDAMAAFMPSTQTMERRLQRYAAIIECTDRDFLPDAIARELEEAGGREKLQGKMTAIKHLLEAS